MSWTIAGTLAALNSAIAGAIGSIAAWRAASSSARSSELAAEALATAIVPSPATRGIYRREGTNEAFAVIANPSPFRARDLTIFATRRDLKRFKGEAAWLADETIEVGVGEISSEALPGYEALVLQDIRIRFSDERSLAVYERIEDYSALIEPPCVPKVQERRLSPTAAPVRRFGP